MKRHSLKKQKYCLYLIQTWSDKAFKGTVSVVLSDPPCKDGNAWFTTVPLKALSDQVWIRD